MTKTQRFTLAATSLGLFMSVHSPAALARSGACSIQTISSRSLPGTVTARARLTRSAERARIIPELSPGPAAQQQMAVIEPCSD